MQTHLSPTVAFIGGGNMAGALIGGLIAAGHAPGSLRAVEIDAQRAQVLRARFGVVVLDTAATASAGAAAVVVAVKPQQVAEALRGLVLAPGTLVVSIAAGVTLSALRSLLGEELHYIRCMPNTPALLGQGISGLYAPDATPADARALGESILKAAGEVVWLDSEGQLDAVTALSGSGPAYFFLLTEVLSDAGARLGLAPAVAARLAQQTFIGAAAMAAQPGADVAQLRTNVTSKGGTTEAALGHLKAGGLHLLFAEALRAAQQRSAELGALLARPA